MCSSDTAFCQITLTTCSKNYFARTTFTNSVLQQSNLVQADVGYFTSAQELLQVGFIKERVDEKRRVIMVKTHRQQTVDVGVLETLRETAFT